MNHLYSDMKNRMDSTDRQTYAAAFEVLRRGGNLRSVLEKNPIENERKKVKELAQNASSRRLAKTLATFAGR